MPSNFDINCRTCLNKSSHYYQLNDNVDENCKIIDMLDSLVPQIKIRNTSQFSTSVCQMCVDKLLIGYKFQQLCLDSHERQNLAFAIDVLETHANLEDMFDPLATQPKIIKVGEYAFLLSELKSEEVNEDERSDNGSFLNEEFENICILPDIPNYENSIQLESFELQNPLSNTYRVKAFAENSQNSDENSNNEPSSNGEAKSKGFASNVFKRTKQPKFQSQNRRVRTYDYSCKVCGKLFDCISNLDRHSSVHSLTRPYECEICKYRFEDEQLYQLHKTEGGVNKNKKGRPKVKCWICIRKFGSYCMMRKHMRSHNPNCEGKLYTNNKSSAPMERGTTTEKCQNAENSFTYKSGTINSNARSNDIQFQLPNVGFQSELVCGEEIRSDSLDNASENILDSSFPTTFNGVSGNKTLIGSKTDSGIVGTQLNKTKRRSKKNVSYNCEICGKIFNRCSSFKRHKSVHSLQKPFKCEICSYRFATAKYLKAHLYLHKK